MPDFARTVTTIAQPGWGQIVRLSTSIDAYGEVLTDWSAAVVTLPCYPTAGAGSSSGLPTSGQIYPVRTP